LDDERPRAIRNGVAVTLFIGLSKHLAVFSILQPLVGLAAAAVQLFIPLREADRSPLGDDGIGYRLDGIARDLLWAAAFFLLTAIPFWFLHEYWWAWVQNRVPGQSSLAIPAGDLSVWLQVASPTLDLVELVLIHFLAVALPEELFYRGYLQPRLCSRFRDHALAWGFRWNHGIALTAALFALAHFIGEYNPARLGPFFPALLFGLLRRRSGGIGGAVFLHGMYNVLGALLFAGMLE
tara:strand:+ start:241 stop:951 length:711 start_codon:yes stop_codon:yes gene_type:complete